MAYQVKRADFDHVLIRNAAREGVEVIEGCKVGRWIFSRTRRRGGPGHP
jgi:flavin-dependent dehydrogenase